MKYMMKTKQEKFKMAKKIGIIGSGEVGKTLANGFIKHGYEVMIGTENAGKYQELKEKTGGKAQVGDFKQTAQFGEIVVLAVKGSAAIAALDKAGLVNLKGKVIIDTTNPIADAPPVNGVLKFFTSLDDSLMERLQKHVPEANFVKAFSCIGSPHMVNPDFGRIAPTMFICGNNEAAKKEIKGILELFGFEVDDMGKVEAARAIEPLCILWCIPGFLTGKWGHGLKMLRK
jgi:predicted dinucleotide-binding enzyme